MDRTVKAPGSDQPGEYREIAGIAGLAVGVPSLVEVAGAAMWTGRLYGGPVQSIPFHSPAKLAWELFSTHSLTWSPEAWAGLGTLAVGTAAGVVGAAVGTRWACGKCRELLDNHRKDRKRAAAARSGRGKTRNVQPELAIDAQARWLANPHELFALTYDAMVAKAYQLGVARSEQDAPGVSIGQTLLEPPQMLYGSYEDLHVYIMGPRAGKSSAQVIPAVMEAFGPVIATSNKRDVVDATRLHRKGLGDVKVFDPQGVAQESCTWFWDPIEWVGGAGYDGGAGALERAARLAGHFAAGGDADKRDAFFDPEGEDLLTGLFLAAAVAKKPITQAYAWITDPYEEEPVDILNAAPGYELVAGGLRDQYGAPDRQKKGVFSTAKKMANCLKYPAIRPWVTPPKDGEAERVSFDVRSFARSRDTVYPLSREGAGTAGPLITALTAAIVEAAEAEGVAAGGRCPVPMLVALDEAANIVKWAELPKQYSHYGSRGIVVMTILQSWAQGVRCWGREGMEALWGAANIRLLGRGLADAAMLRDTSELVGQHYEITSSTTQSKAKEGSSSSTSWNRVTETTLTTSDLAAIPPWRALLMASGYRPTLVRLIPWWEREYAEEIKASQAKYAPRQKSLADLHGGDSAPSSDPDTEGDDA